MAGWESMMLAAVLKPGYEMPQMPTRPLLLGTWWSSQSTVSYMSVLGSTSVGDFFSSRCGAISMNLPSDSKRPRTSWLTKM